MVNGSQQSASPVIAAAAQAARTVLAVDDEPQIRNILSQLFGKAGYNVLVAENVGQALEILGRDGDVIDLLITDFHLQGHNCGNGDTLLSNPLVADNRRIGKILLSGAGDDAVNGFVDMRAEMGALADRIILKPFDLADVLCASTEVLAKKAKIR